MADLDVILTRARAVDPGRVLGTIVAAPFWAIGWLVGILWLGLVFLGSAIAVGFGDARRTGEGDEWR